MFFLFRMDRDRYLRMPREALIVIGDIVREAEDLSEALFNARSKSTPQLRGFLLYLYSCNLGVKG